MQTKPGKKNYKGPQNKTNRCGKIVAFLQENPDLIEGKEGNLICDINFCHTNIISENSDNRRKES